MAGPYDREPREKLTYITSRKFNYPINNRSIDEIVCPIREEKYFLYYAYTYIDIMCYINLS